MERSQQLQNCYLKSDAATGVAAVLSINMTHSSSPVVYNRRHVSRPMQHGNNLDRSSSFPHAVDNQIGIRRPEEHLFGGEIRTRVARTLPLCQVLEGGKTVRQ